MYKQINFRIRKRDNKGWVSEIRKPKWTLFGIKWKWTHFISVSGIDHEPWYFTHRCYAEDETLKRIKQALLNNWNDEKE